MSSEKPKEEKAKEEKAKEDIPVIAVDGAITMPRKDGATVTLFHKTKPVAKLEITAEALARLIGGLKGPPGPRH